MRILLAISISLLFVACATAPREMHFFPQDVSVDSPAGWPAPPEETRLRYAGELIGEVNFRNVDGAREGAATRFLRWVAGIGQRSAAVLELERPQSGTVDQYGRILVTDAGRKSILVFDRDQATLSVWEDAAPGLRFESPVGIVASSEGYFVADSEIGALIRLANDGSPQALIGRGVLNRPTGVARDAATGDIYVADSASHDIKVFSGSGELSRTIGSRGDDESEFNGPTHLNFSNGRLYVTDTLNARVQVLTASGEFVSSIGERGLFVGNLVRPKGVASDPDGNIYIVESYYDHLLVFNEQGEYLLPIGGTGSAIGQFFLPSGIWIDNSNRIYVADMFNGRIVLLDYIGGGE